MGRRRVPVVCEPFELDEAQAEALGNVVVNPDAIADQLIREWEADQAEAPQTSAVGERR